MIQNKLFHPFLPLNEYIPDGEPHVFGDRIYLYGSHDKAGGETYCEGDYEFYSAPLYDLTNWTSRGISYRASQDPDYGEERRYLFAPDCVQGNDGRYYLYYAISGKNGNGGYHGPIRVAVSDAPDGPFDYYGTVSDRQGKPFVRCVPFDPAVINDDGQIRLYYGAGFPFENYGGGIRGKLSVLIQEKMLGKTKEEILGEPLGMSGALTVELADDMVTVISEPKKITPAKTKGTPWEAHPFFEASSIRKIGDTYYFLYSSQASHELCYATSRYPDRDFVYRGVVISNGDVGYHGRKFRERIALTGNNHGSLACVNGQWYIFYHRPTHGTNFSRQACAEPVTIRKDGSIPQVPVTSCGFSVGALKAEGVYSAAVACILRNRHMGIAGSPLTEKYAPKIVEKGGELYITDITHGTKTGFRYFAFSGEETEIVITVRGSAKGTLYVGTDRDTVAPVAVNPSAEWTKVTARIAPERGRKTLLLVYRGKGRLDFRELEFIRRK